MPSLSKNAKQYISGFIWLAIAISIASITQLVSSVIPNQNITIGRFTYSQSTTTTTVKTVVLSPSVITTNVSPLFQVYASITNAVQSPRGDISGTTRMYVINGTSTVAVFVALQTGLLMFAYDGAFRGLAVYSNNTLITSRTAREGQFSPGYCPLGVVCDYGGVGVTNLNFGNAEFYVNNINVYRPLTTITTSVPVTTTVAVATPVDVLVPADNAVMISNRTILELIGFGVFVLIAIIAINKLLKMII